MFKMTYIAVPTVIAVPAVMRSDSLNFGVIALIVLSLVSVVIGVSHPEASTAEYQTTAMVGP
jgi:hypothetical protein